MEITLLGQNVNAYGKDLYDDYGMENLLEDVAKTSVPRIKFVTSHPWDFTDKMIDIIAKYDNIMPFIHLPVQSGSNKILKLMGRRYTKEEYLKLFNKIKDKIKNVSITTDIIVGFPSEEESDFNEIRKVVGEEKHKLTIDELAEHTHSVSGNPVWGQKHTYGQITPGTSGQANDTDITDISVGKSGSDTPHNNIQPTEVVGYMWIRRK